MHLLALLGLFAEPFNILQLGKSVPFLITKTYLRNPFRSEPSLISHYREYPPPPPALDPFNPQSASL